VSDTRSRRRASKVALALALLGALPIGVALLDRDMRYRWRVGWIRRGLRSEDASVRHATRLRLLDFKRPAIDGVYPELVASEIADELEGTDDVVVIVGQRWKEAIEREPRWAFFDIEEVLRVSPRFAGVYDYTERLSVIDDAGCPVARKLARSAKREIVVAALRPRGTLLEGQRELRVAVPLDDDLAPAILEAVRERLRKL
jgi:hypothetical protein